MKLITILLVLIYSASIFSQETWQKNYEQSLLELENQNIQKAQYLAEIAQKEITKTNEPDLEKGKVANHLGYIYHSQGKSEKALELYMKSENLWASKEGSGDADFATLMSSVAMLYEDEANYEQAEKYYLKSISEFELAGINKNSYCYLLYSLGNVYQLKADYDLAVPILSSVVNMYKKEGLFLDDTYINTLILLGSIYNETNDFESAIQPLETALEYGDSPSLLPQRKLINLLYRLGESYHGLREYETAIEYFQTAMEMGELSMSLHGYYVYLYCDSKFETKEYKESYSKLQQVLGHVNQNQVKANFKVYSNLLNDKLILELKGVKNIVNNVTKTKELAMSLFGEGTIDYAYLLNEQGLLYYKSGYYQNAELSYKKALEILSKNKINKVEYSNILINYAQLKLDFGDLETSERVLSNLLKAYQENNLVNSSFVLIMQTLGKLYEKQSEFDKAELLLTEVGRVQEALTGKNHLDYAVYLNTIGSFYFNVGNFSKAVNHLIKSSEIIEETSGTESLEYATSLNNIAMLYNYIEDFDEALALQKRSLLIEEKRIGRDNSDFAVGLYNQSNIYISLGDYLNAEKNLEEALKTMNNVFGTSHPEYARILARLGKLHFLIGEYDLSRQELETSVNIFQRTYGNNNEETISFNIDLANTQNKLGDYEKALTNFRSSIQFINENIRRYNSYFSETEKALYLQTLSSYFNSYYVFIVDNYKNHPELCGLLYNNLLNTKGALLRSTMAMRKRVLASSDSELKNQYDRWIYLNKSITENQSIPEEKRFINIEEYKEEANDIEKRLVQAVFKEGSNENWKAIQTALKEGEVCIEFFTCGKLNKSNEEVKTYYALLLQKEELFPKIIELCSEESLEEIVGIVTGSDIWVVNKMYGTIEEPSNELYQLIWKPIEEIISDKKKVYYSPTGLLHKISFNAIHKTNGKYLIDQHQMIPLITTNTIADKIDVLIENGDDAILFGGVNYNSETSSKEVWNYLEGTKSEVEKIQTVIGRNSRLYEGELATEENFKENTKDKAIIHLATHGFFFPNPADIQREIIKETEVIEDLAFRGVEVNGASSFTKNKDPLMRSGLVLARANDLWSDKKYAYKDDGMLTASEVAQMDLQKTKLVVLSACETGLGDINGDEGVYGLQRAFKIAGVKKIIMSLWQVPDAQTKEFMILFYQNLKKLKSVEEAFYNTQKTMSINSSPYYWAAFILVE